LLVEETDALGVTCPGDPVSDGFHVCFGRAGHATSLHRRPTADCYPGSRLAGLSTTAAAPMILGSGFDDTD
jgi:hypothetical protein